MMRRFAAGALAIAAAAAAAPPAYAEDAAPRVAIVSATPASALVYWDATADFVQIVKIKASNAAANARLERGSLRALAEIASQVSSSKSITVQVIYNETPDVNPAYGAFTFAGIEKYANLKITSADARDDKGKWREAAIAKDGSFPRSVTFTIIGKLPPR